MCGTLCALVTPMDRQGHLDLPALAALVQWQLQAGVEGFVPCGTTGEATALTAAERREVIACVAAEVPAGTAVLAGTGSASTQEAQALLQQARDAGATAALVVTPPYCRPSDAGLRRHYLTLAEADLLPLVAYNVPSRTGCDLTPALMGELARHPNVVGIKEASGELDRLAAVQQLAPHLAILSGDDLSACAFNLMGGDGVVSVAANVAPTATTQMVAAARRGDVATARRLHAQLRPLFAALFIESNPVPTKAALSLLGKMQATVRSPLAALLPHNQQRLQDVLQAQETL